MTQATKPRKKTDLKAVLEWSKKYAGLYTDEEAQAAMDYIAWNRGHEPEKLKPLSPEERGPIGSEVARLRAEWAELERKGETQVEE